MRYNEYFKRQNDNLFTPESKRLTHEDIERHIKIFLRNGGRIHVIGIDERKDFNPHDSSGRIKKVVVGRHLETGEIVRFDSLRDTDKRFSARAIGTRCRNGGGEFEGYWWRYENG